MFALQDPDHAVHLRLKTPEKTHLRPIGSHPAIGKDWKYAIDLGYWEINENQLDIGKSSIGNIGTYWRKRLEIYPIDEGYEGEKKWENQLQRLVDLPATDWRLAISTPQQSQLRTVHHLSSRYGLAKCGHRKHNAGQNSDSSMF